MFGKASFLIDGTVSGQTVKFNVATYDNGVKGNCLATFWVNGDASLYKAYVEDGSANKLTADLQLSNYSQATPVQINYVCTSGALPVLETTSASAAAIRVDNVTSGIATNLGTVNQAEMLGSLKYAAAVNCTWETTSTSYVSFSNDADCATPTVLNKASAPATKIPGITFAVMPPGDYLVVAQGNFRKNSGAGSSAFFRLFDGTNAYSENRTGQSDAGDLATGMTSFHFRS